MYFTAPTKSQLNSFTFFLYVLLEENEWIKIFNCYSTISWDSFVSNIIYRTKQFNGFYEKVVFFPIRNLLRTKLTCFIDVLLTIVRFIARCVFNTIKTAIKFKYSIFNKIHWIRNRNEFLRFMWRRACAQAINYK